jgi:hypothetical protein
VKHPQSVPPDHTPDLADIKAPVLLIRDRCDRMVPFEVSIAILNYVAD